MSDREPTDTNADRTDDTPHRESPDDGWTRADVNQAGDTTTQSNDRHAADDGTREQSDASGSIDERSDGGQPTGPEGSQPTNPPGSPSRTNQSAEDSGFGPDVDVIRLLKWGGLGAACLIAGSAYVRFHANATSAIATFAAPEYESLFLAGFNLAVLLAAGVVISLLVRELAGSDDGSMPMSANK